jgi:glutamyl-tRNA reductase
MNDTTLANRKAEVPKAKSIISKYIAEFNDWIAMRRHAPILNAVKIKLKELHTSALFFNYTSTSSIAEIS